MAGIYVHIPLCKSRCSYCAFYSTTKLSHADHLVAQIVQEMCDRKDELHEDIHTIYFGGGTPTLLSTDQLHRLLQTIHQNYCVSPDAEITIEGNPGDFHVNGIVQRNRLQELRSLGFNRLSLGIQSFQDQALTAIGRRHTAQEARETVAAAQEAGFSNISIDLIYGLPHVSREQWEDDIRQAIALGVQHVSGYGLSVEEGTALHRMREEGCFTELDEDEMNLRQELLTQRLADAGFEHYEVSNYAKTTYRSRHNSSYWDGTPYLGFGPGAHSYDGQRTRRWNGDWDIPKGSWEHESEVLSDDELYEERVMLGLRRKEGIDLEALQRDFGEKRLQYCLCQAEKFLKDHLIVKNGNNLAVSEAGLRILNIITSELFA